MVTVEMPQLGETVTEGTITTWRVAVGDHVSVDDVLVEISTDKVDAEIPSPVAGTVTQLLVAEGDVVEIGAPIVAIGDGAAADESPSPQVEAPPAEAPPPPSPPPPPPEAADREAVPEPSPPGPPVAARSAPVVEGAPPPPPRSDDSFLSPAVRRRLAETGLDPSGISGTGIGGRISLRDVERALVEGPPAASAPKPAPASAATRPAAPAPVATTGDETIPFSPIRRATAEHMVRSLATSAHTLVVVEVDYAGVDVARIPAKEAFRAEHGASLTYLPFIARATVDALRRFPQINAVVGDDELIVKRDINLGFAVDLDFEGLIVPVVHHADRYRLPALASEMAAKAARARERALTTDDVSGGTFTITNAGGFGTLITGPIINQPQVAILSTDGVATRPVAVPDGSGGHALGFHPVGNLAVSFDHRAFDGAYASAFLADIRDQLQDRDWEVEL